MIKSFLESCGAGWNGLLASLDTPGGHVMLFVCLYIGMCFAHCSEADRQGVLNALFLVLRPGGKS